MKKKALKLKKLDSSLQKGVGINSSLFSNPKSEINTSIWSKIITNIWQSVSDSLGTSLNRELQSSMLQRRMRR
jgi:hypothetical protein